MNYTPEQLREWADYFDQWMDTEQRTSQIPKRAVELRTHADKIEECERLQKDAERFDWLERQWTNGLHVELCAVGGVGDSLISQASVYYGSKEATGKFIREAIDAAIKESK